MKGLYFFHRCLPFINTVWLVSVVERCWGVGGIWGSLHVGTWNLGSASYIDITHNGIIFLLDSVLMTVGLAASEMILTIRTCVWNRNHRLSIILPTLYALVWGSCFFFLSRFLNSLRFTVYPFPGFKGCFVTHVSKDLNFLWILLAAWNTTLMSIPAVRTCN
ncbi:hypothetical protein M413DRAFT_137911 [Hebeloma cylindrosporum]|uniref:Uncharacterized protein n=1 Tax=Hebeloma cylindrosporum TaxID=76867 RepID=A0A0C2XVV4_HEBCY|nr:hypothetical protein M413DRAFT_137911 [Hebeloma cylindrosporum h7]